MNNNQKSRNADDKYMAIVWGTFIPFCFFFIKIVYSVYLNAYNPDYEGTAPDFLAFWSAAKMAIAGEAASAYDQTQLILVQWEAFPNFTIFLPWLNPPVFLFFIYPLGYLDFFSAFIVWIFLTTSICAWYCSRLVPAKLIIPAIFCTFPFYAAFSNGQNSILLTALWAATSYCFLSRKQYQAGIMIALMLFKPQYGILVPFALIAGKEWRTLFSATAGSVFILFAAFFCFGFEPWQQLMEENTVFFNRQIANPDTNEEFGLLYSVYGVIRYFFDCSYEAAMSIQAFISLLCALITIRVWIHKKIPYEIKLAVLITASLLCNYYVYWHDLFLLTVPVILLLRSQKDDNKIKHENIFYIGLIYMTYLTNAVDWQIMFLPLALIIYILYRRYVYYAALQ